jgi:DNA-binding SARP family transcriptional activator
MSDVRPDGNDATVSRAANPLAPRMRVPHARTLPRARLNVLFDEIWAHRLTLVVAAAGCGKTTALAQFVARSTDPVAWYRADVSDSSTSRFLECLATALAPCLPGFPKRWDDPVEMALAVEDYAPPRAALLVDDLHTLRGTPAEAAFTELLVHLPPAFSVAVATRSQPDVDVSRLLLDGDVLHITSDDLRFRTWETEALFRELYGLRIPPEELARLTRRVRGWPAGLRLYQLAARGKTPIEQRRLVDVLSTRIWPMRDYLTRNILDTLRPELREFLISTSVLGVVTPQLSDELLERSDSDALLRELESLDLLTTPLDDTGCAYHYHEVLRSHLEARLLDRDDRAGRKHLVRAGELLESHGWIAEALRCFGRAEAWESVARIVGAGAPSVGASWAWLDTLPPALVASDPWLLLCRARAKVSAGKLADGFESYRELERVVDAPDLVDACRRERTILATWLESRAVHADDWHGRLRLATQRDPARAFENCTLTEPGAALGAGIASLLAGELAQATRQLASAASDTESGPAMLAGAQLAYAIALVLGAGSGEAHQIDLAEEAAERVEVAWLARLARAALALTDRAGVLDGDEPVWAMCDSDGDEWGAALARFLTAWRAVKTGDPTYETTIADVVERFQRLNAPVLVAWAQSLLAVGLARSGRNEATKCATVAERRARTLQIAGARALAICALDLVEGSERGVGLLRNCALDPSGFIRDGEPSIIAASAPVPAAATYRVQLFGSFQLFASDEVIDLKALRPRVRSLVRFLALNSGKLVHREAVLEALWPNAGFDSGRSNLHTAVSAARQVLEPFAFTLERESDSYRLVTPPGTTWDTAEFQTMLQSAQRARSAGDSTRAYDDFAQALALYTDDLLTEEGPSEWIVAHRDRLRHEAVNAAIAAAEIALATDRHADAVAACERAVILDPCADRAWELMTSAFERSGSRASAQRARQAYLDVQQKLGITARDIDEADRGTVRRPGTRADALAT